MRNQYSGQCYKCSKEVKPKEGHFERRSGRWAVIHVDCVFEQRREKELSESK